MVNMICLRMVEAAGFSNGTTQKSQKQLILLSNPSTTSKINYLDN